LYLIRDLVLHYVPKADTQNGSIIIRYEPNVLDDAPRSKAEYLNTSHVLSTGAIGYGSKRIPVADLAIKRRFKVALSYEGQEGPSRNPEYHQGVIQVLTTGFANAATLGELWIDYDIQFWSRAERIRSIAESYQQVGAGATTGLFTGAAKRELADLAVPVIMHVSDAALPTRFNFHDSGHWRAHLHLNGTGLGAASMAFLAGDTFAGGTPVITVLSNFVNAAQTFASMVVDIYIPEGLRLTPYSTHSTGAWPNSARVVASITAFTTMVKMAMEVISHKNKKVAFTF
jgi:hypothetical protein